MGGEILPFRKKMGLPLAAACMVLGVMVIAQSATASHPRPKAATPYLAALAVAYANCPGEAGAFTHTHGGGLPAPSCAGFLQNSKNLTTGTPDANGASALQVGYIRLDVIVGDVRIEANDTDVRCQPGMVASRPDLCGSVDAAGGLNCGLVGSACVATPGNPPVAPNTPPDYLGQVQGSVTIRITDHNQTPPPGTTATVFNLAFPVVADCSGPGPNPPVGTPFGPTPSKSIGSTCARITTANAIVAGAASPGVRGNVEFVDDLKVFDAGTDGLITTPTDNRVFKRNGIFIP